MAHGGVCGCLGGMSRLYPAHMPTVGACLLGRWLPLGVCGEFGVRCLELRWPDGWFRVVGQGVWAALGDVDSEERFRQSQSILTIIVYFPTMRG